MHQPHMQDTRRAHAEEADTELVVDMDDIGVECLEQAEPPVTDGLGDTVVVELFDMAAGQCSTPSLI